MLPPAGSVAAPLPFDWHEYLSLAEQLAPMTVESALRTAISRAYYAAFHKAQEIYRQDNPVAVSGLGGQSHTDVWLWFEKHNSRAYRSIGKNGWDMKRRRETADYKDKFPGLEQQVIFQLETARKLIKELDQFSSR